MFKINSKINSNSKTYNIILGSFLFVLVLVVIFFSFRDSWLRIYGVRTMGIVTESYRAGLNGGVINIMYKDSDGNEYILTKPVDLRVAPLLRKGDSLIVYYYPKNPGNALVTSYP